MSSQETESSATTSSSSPDTNHDPSKNGATSTVKAKPSQYIASACPGPDTHLPPEVGLALAALRDALKLPLWMIVQSGDNGANYPDLDEEVWEAFFDTRHELPSKQPIALLIHSPGGQAESAYKIASVIRRRCGGFVAVVPRYAKSAATLLALGGALIVMGTDAELGPLDAQIFDPEQERWSSALDEVQALERVNAFALQAINEFVLFTQLRSGKKVNTLMPSAMKFVEGMMQPLLNKIDTIHYSQSSRVLKVAEEYAVRLLMPKYSRREAEKIARHLVEKYPQHEFVIDVEETEKIGLRVSVADDQVASAIDALIPHLDKINVIGELREVTA